MSGKSHTQDLRLLRPNAARAERRLRQLLQSSCVTCRFVLREHEAFVIKLNALRPSVACLAGCRIFTELAKVRYQSQSFT
ncbi:hypothetical protein FQ187_26020 [Pseudomonas sp. ANT_J28]|nr:hypothetical protein FQ187_26020 [Pseudomonas sp. ANT_J28]